MGQTKRVYSNSKTVLPRVALLFLLLLLLTVLYREIVAADDSSVTELNMSCKGKRAIIIDSLSLQGENNAIIARIIELLVRAGYAVTYHGGGSVTPEVFSNITSYNLVIIRAHVGAAILGNGKTIIGIVTGEPWSKKYEKLYVRGLVAPAKPYNNSQLYVALLPRFLRDQLHGSFCPGSTVILSGCYGAYSRDLAEALKKHGLEAYISWSNSVDLDTADKALYMLIENVILKEMDWIEAVNKVNERLERNSTRLEVMVLR